MKNQQRRQRILISVALVIILLINSYINCYQIVMISGVSNPRKLEKKEELISLDIASNPSFTRTKGHIEKLEVTTSNHNEPSHFDYYAACTITEATRSPPAITNPLAPNDRLVYPPYLERYVGSRLTYAIKYDAMNNRLFFSLVGHGLGIYYLENNSFQEFSLSSPEQSSYPENVITALQLAGNSSKLYAGTMAGLLIINLENWTVTKKNESAGLAYNRIWSLALDERNGKLFVGTDNGFSIFFTANQTFLEQNQLPAYLREGYIGEMAFNAETNILYMARADKLYSYNLSANTLEKLFQSGEAFNFSNIRSLAFDEATDRLFLGCYGITIFNVSSRKVITNYNEKDGLQSHVVKAISFEPSLGGMVFASQLYNGLAVLNCSSGALALVRREEGLLSNDVGALAVMNSAGLVGNIFVRREDSATRTITTKHQSSNNSGCYPTHSKKAPSTLIAGGPILVIGVRGALVFYQIREGEINETIVINFDLPTSNVWEVDFNEQHTHLFVGAEEYLCIFDPATKHFTNYDYVAGLPRAFIKATIEDAENNRLFVATSNGLSIFDCVTEQVIRTYTTIDGLSHNNVQSMLFSEEREKLFIGTLNGLSILNLATEEVENYLVNTTGDYNNIKSLALDKENQRLFIGTSNHLQILSLETKTFEPFSFGTAVYDKFVYALQFYPEKQILFVGTANGLYVLDLRTMEISKHYTELNSDLTSSIVISLVFDATNETLFVGTYWGLIIYDFAHDFWINFNEDARLEQEGLYEDYISDLCYYNKKLYLTIPHAGFYILSLDDTDADGMYDCCEGWIFGTDPRVFDSDADGYSDGEELWAGTDPLDPSSLPKDRPTLQWWAILLLATAITVATVGVSTTILLRIAKGKKRTKQLDN